MEVVISLILGYYIGSKLGPVDLDKAAKAWQDINESKEGQDILTSVVDIAAVTAQQGVRSLLTMFLTRKAK